MADHVAKPKNTAPQSFNTFPEAKQAGEHFTPFPTGRSGDWLAAHARQTILAEPMALYSAWHEVERTPLWQENVVSVTKTGDKTSHWVMGDPSDDSGKRLEFDSVLTEDVPGEKIAWKSVAGDLEQRGEVYFAKRSDGRGTVVTLIQRFKIGKLANAASSTADRGPEQAAKEDLRHFKQLNEAGQIPNVDGQPHGPRGLSGRAKRWMYGETVMTPAGTSVNQQGTANVYAGGSR